MLKIKVLSVGKTKEAWLQEAWDEYSKRLKAVLQIETVWAKDDKQLETLASKEERLLILDPAGKLYSSEAFSSLLCDELERGGSKATFLIGGAAGIPTALKSRAGLISLSPLTFTHQMTRLILIEQIYRALEIAKGSNYHK